MRSVAGKSGRRYWIEVATGKRTRPGKPLTAPQPRAPGGQFRDKTGHGRKVGEDRKGQPVYAPVLAPVRGKGGRFVEHPLRQAAERMRRRLMSISDYRALAGAYGLTERQLWSIYDAGS
jgi:hypothetical protein